MRTRSTDSELVKDRVTVLCIEQGQPVLADRTTLLESAGYRVLPAANANAAMQLFLSNQVDLVLSNNDLHGISGAELSIFMRQVRAVRVVLLSNSAQIPAGLLSRVDACIEQDSSAEELLLCLLQAMPKQPAVPARGALMLMEA
jgi:CheY-like chemotaxis protein